MGSSLPPFFAEKDFYHIFFVMSIITVLIVGTVFWRKYLHRHTSTDSPETRMDYRWAYEWLARGIGALWLLDGLLQAQPLMITRFIGGYLAPMLSGQPAPVESLIDMGLRLWAISPVLWNEFAAWIQIGIGLTILMGQGTVWRRVGLWTSLGWGAIVWVSGEAFGSLFVSGSWLNGTPGSVFLYMAVAVALLAPAAYWKSPAIRRALTVGMTSLWALAAVLQAWPTAGWWTGRTLSNYVLSMATMPQPAFFSGPLFAWAASLAHYPALWNGLLVAAFTALALLWAFKPRSLWTWWLTAFVTVATWWLGQDFGVLGGMGTDPNSGVVVMLGLAVYAQLAHLRVLGQATHRSGALEHSTS